MPRILKGKRMTEHEEEIWRSAYEGAKKSKADEPGAVATSAVLKHRAKSSVASKKKSPKKFMRRK